MFVIERLIDMAAREIGIDRVELRRRNLITTLPHRNAFGITYDSGDYVGTLDQVLKLADWTGYGERREQSAARGLKRGLGKVLCGSPIRLLEVVDRSHRMNKVVRRLDARHRGRE